jgi:hypothetical protein
LEAAVYPSTWIACYAEAVQDREAQPAEFIRTQIKLARLNGDRGNPDWIRLSALSEGMVDDFGERWIPN